MFFSNDISLSIVARSIPKINPSRNWENVTQGFRYLLRLRYFSDESSVMTGFCDISGSGFEETVDLGRFAPR